MEIIDNRAGEKVPFSLIKIGECFLDNAEDERDLMIKTDNRSTFNAVSLRTGVTYGYGSCYPVFPVRAKVTVY